MILDHQSDVVNVMTGSIEGGVVRYDESDVDGGHDDDDVPQAFQVSVMGEHKLRLLGSGCFVFRKWLV